MTVRMIVDAANSEETRVVIADEDRVKEFEVETVGKEQVRGNIYVGEVVRVEPSLQAAFLRYGGERNGFLAFSEVHPECFDLPKKEKDALVAELEEIAARQNRSFGDDDTEDDVMESKAAAEAEDIAESTPEEVKASQEEEKPTRPRRRARASSSKKGEDKTGNGSDLTEEEAAEDARALAIANAMNFDTGETAPAASGSKRGGRLRRATESESKSTARRPARRSTRKKEEEKAPAKEASPAPDTKEDRPRRQPPIHRRYNIQDVLKEGQKILVQVAKEERGTKGAALTTHISLPGRFVVLMPNTPYAGGISRKINDAEERRHLRNVMKKVEVPKGMGLIVRTAGVGQEAEAIRADLKNLLTHWERITGEVKDAAAATCLYEDGSLIVRAMRDMLSDEVDEVIISGNRTYKTAKEYAKLLLPERAKIIKEHTAKTPIFSHHGVETALNHLHHSRVNLESGGYLIINPTEALVSVDINSGRATQERNIEETALKTNLEAAEEVARQLRLRDLSGLIVIDFIDMEERRHERAVERAMRKAVRKDRARIQIGSISEFGLLEMSRQRMRPSFNESTLVRCPHCLGAGMLPSVQTSALMLLRNLEQENIHAKADRIIITASVDLAIYLLNHKLDYIHDLEARYKCRILVRADEKFIGPDHQLEMVRVQASGSERAQTRTVVLRETPETTDGRSRKRRRSAKKDSGRNSGRKRDADTKETASSTKEKGEESGRGRRGGRKASTDKDKPAKTPTASRASARRTKKEETPGEEKTFATRTRAGGRRAAVKKEETSTKDEATKPATRKTTTTRGAKSAKTSNNGSATKAKKKAAPVVSSALTVETVGSGGNSVSEVVSGADKGKKEEAKRWWQR